MIIESKYKLQADFSLMDSITSLSLKSSCLGIQSPNGAVTKGKT